MFKPSLGPSGILLHSGQARKRNVVYWTKQRR